MRISIIEQWMNYTAWRVQTKKMLDNREHNLTLLRIRSTNSYTVRMISRHNSDMVIKLIDYLLTQ